MNVVSSVLVVGAGPSGLMAALELARRGIDVRIVDRRLAPSVHSKAIGVWPRTFELLRRIAPTAVLESAGRAQDGMRYYADRREIVTIRFTDTTRATVLPQPFIEEFLIDQLGRRGVHVERGVTAFDVEQDSQGVSVRVELPDRTRTILRAAFVIGADGASSLIRGSLGIGFEGATHPTRFVVIDADMDGDLDPAITHYFQSGDGVLVVTALPGDRWRLFMPAPAGTTAQGIASELVQRIVDERGPGRMRLGTIHWSSVFHVHARRAEVFRERRVFLVGDAAHIHSPAGGQGMNAGIADAHNLAWKLARVVTGVSHMSLLDTFEEERAPVTAQIVAAAEMQTFMWSMRSWWRVALRNTLLRIGTRTPYFGTRYLRTLAGLRHDYSSLRDPSSTTGVSVGRTGKLLDALSVLDESSGLRVPLREAVSDDGFTVLVEGLPNPAERVELDRLHEAGVHIRALDRKRRRLLHHLPPDGMRVRRVTLVRPDGYVAYDGPHDRDRLLQGVGSP